MQYKVALFSFFAALAMAAPTPDGLPDGTTCTIDSTTTTKCVDGTCYAVNEGCSSRICAVPSGSEIGSCQTETKKLRRGLPDGTTCTIGSTTTTKCVDGTCYAVNEGCSSRICAVPSGSEVGTCQTETKKREAAPELLEKRCTANGGSCTQLSQCCSGNCEYDSSIGLVCKA